MRYRVHKGTFYTLTRYGKIYEATLNLTKVSGRKYSFLQTSQENIFAESDILTAEGITKATSCQNWAEVNERFFLSQDSYDGQIVQSDTLVKPFGVSLEILEKILAHDLVYLSDPDLDHAYGMLVSRKDVQEIY